MVAKDQPKYRRQVQLEKNAAGGLGLRISGGVIDGVQHPVLVRAVSDTVARGLSSPAIAPCLFPISIDTRTTEALPACWRCHSACAQIQGVEPGKPAAESGQIYSGGERACPTPSNAQISCSCLPSPRFPHPTCPHIP